MIDNTRLTSRSLAVPLSSSRTASPDTASAGPTPQRMTPAERRSSAALAGVYALRMLGLFIVLPVFALQARHYPGGDDPALVGLAMGIYGLTQALLQVPLGMASDRLGRKPVILAGLALFVLGSVVAAWAPTMAWLVAGRALQGAGAVSAAVTALLADLTRDAVRTKAMALVGISIALMFALSLVAAPLLVSWVGLSGLFAVTAGLSLTAMAVVAWVVPPEPVHAPGAPRARLAEVLRNTELLRVDLGVFVLHAAQIMTWLSVPALLVQAGLPTAQHWQVYLPAVLASLLIVGGLLFRLERKGLFRAVYLGAIALIGLVQLGFIGQLHAPSLAVLGVLLCLYFVGFNTQEAGQPSLVSRLAPAQQRGTALGIYNTLMSLGIFAGGAVGGVVARVWGPVGIFALSTALVVLWLIAAWPMKPMALDSARR